METKMDLLDKARQLQSAGRPFALAIVVRREPPVSVRMGDKAIIEPDGAISGWIGGGCTRPVILREARRCLREGVPRLVRVTPSSDSPPQQGVEEHAMACHSGGTVDVYIEPMLPSTQLVILGRSPVGQSLVSLGKALGYQVAVAAPKATSQEFPDAGWVQSGIDLARLGPAPLRAVIICTQGEQDEKALQEALRSEAAYIALVASRKKAQSLLQGLSEMGFEQDQLDRIKAPAGLDIGAASAGEIAVSILAEFIQRLHSSQSAKAAKSPAPEAELPRDPVCGMRVDPASAAHTSEREGETFYFCCAGCKKAFDSGGIFAKGR